MKHIIIILLVLIGFQASAFSATTRYGVSDGGKKELCTVVFATNIRCNNCKKKIESNIAYEKGVKDLEVNLEDKTVTITYRSDKTDSEKLRDALQKLGYTALIKEEHKKTL